MKSAAPKKKASSKFKLNEAYKQLKLEKLTFWKIDAAPLAATEVLQSHLDRLKLFDLERTEEGKKLLIDAILLEAIQPFKQLKIWKGANLESEIAHGAADYLITENRGYFEGPFLCIIEAKKDDFDQGLAQCLVEMQACQWSHQKISRPIAVFGIVTNSEGWKFYQLTPSSGVSATILQAIGELAVILGCLNYLFAQCEQNLSPSTP